MSHCHCSKNVVRCFPVPLTEVQLRGIFQRHDLNCDGRLSREELKDAFRWLGAYIPPWRAGRALHHADRYGDGCISGEAELDQLVKYALKCGYTIH